MKNWLLLSILILSCLFCSAQIKLPKLISNGMILQRDEPTKIWGWAAPAEKITIEFDKKTYATDADYRGKWNIIIPAQPAGGPYEMTLSASNRITISDILFGDVYLCSGQSNMETPMGRLIDKYPDEIVNAVHNDIRQFLVADEYDFKAPRNDLSRGSWESVSPKSILNFSAVGYFFALDINKKYGIPVGIINAAVGGSPAQAWLSEETIKKFPGYYAELKRFKDDALIRRIDSTDRSLSDRWNKKLNDNDEGLRNNWKSDVDQKDWNEMDIPGYWANGPSGQINGSVWFKKEFDIPKSMLEKPVKLLLGRLIDADSTFVNGIYVGSTGYQYPPRRYLFDSTVLKEGKNTITVRLINNSGKGGFVKDKPYQLIAGQDTIDLRGTWKYKFGSKMEPAPAQTSIGLKPVGLYNAMIAPLQFYKIKGVLWYQGESNTDRPNEYSKLMSNLIADWRAHWEQGVFPFLYVQLPNFMEAKNIPSESNWAALREQQRNLDTIANTAMAVTIDIGEWNDIHPLNKQDVAKRLALQAGHLIYGDKQTTHSGPIFKGIERSGTKLMISFSAIDKGLKSKDGQKLKYFAIAAADKKFVWADAIIKDNRVIVGNNKISHPVFVRYAWADNPEGANLCNQADLPASPFEAELK